MKVTVAMCDFCKKEAARNTGPGSQMDDYSILFNGGQFVVECCDQCANGMTVATLRRRVRKMQKKGPVL